MPSALRGASAGAPAVDNSSWAPVLAIIAALPCDRATFSGLERGRHEVAGALL